MFTSPEAIYHYLDIFEETLDQNDLSSKPCQIYNCDETGMPLDQRPIKVIAQKGQKHTQSITTGNKKPVKSRMADLEAKKIHYLPLYSPSLSRHTTPLHNTTFTTEEILHFQ